MQNYKTSHRNRQVIVGRCARCMAFVVPLVHLVQLIQLISSLKAGRLAGPGPGTL